MKGISPQCHRAGFTNVLRAYLCRHGLQGPFFCKAERRSVARVYHGVIVPSSVEGHGGRFQVLALVSGAVMNTGYRYLFKVLFSIPLDNYPAVGLLGHVVVLF